MAARELGRVQRDGDDLPLAYANLDAAADQVRVKRVVVGIKPQVRVGREHARALRERRGARSDAEVVVEQRSLSVYDQVIA